MKKIILAIMMVGLSVVCAMAQKKAILVVQYGSIIDESRTKSIDLIFNEIKSAHQDMEVRQAYISRCIRKSLGKRGIVVESPEEALLRLHMDGYDTVYVQPTLITDGKEMNSVRDDVSKVSALFKKLEVGTPLLYMFDDFKAVVPVLLSEKAPKGCDIIWVGHGNEMNSTAAYCMLDELASQASKGYHVSTIEGYPDVELTISQLKSEKVKKAIIVPLLLANGVHTTRDINDNFKATLEAAGISSTVQFTGFAERKEVRDFYLSKVAALLQK